MYTELKVRVVKTWFNFYKKSLKKRLKCRIKLIFELYFATLEQQGSIQKILEIELIAKVCRDLHKLTFFHNQ